MDLPFLHSSILFRLLFFPIPKIKKKKRKKKHDNCHNYITYSLWKAYDEVSLLPYMCVYLYTNTHSNLLFGLTSGDSIFMQDERKKSVSLPQS